jgi:hypothetical protein
MSTSERTWADIIIAVSLLAVLIPRYEFHQGCKCNIPHP